MNISFIKARLLITIAISSVFYFFPAVLLAQASIYVDGVVEDYYVQGNILRFRLDDTSCVDPVQGPGKWYRIDLNSEGKRAQYEIIIASYHASANNEVRIRPVSATCTPMPGNNDVEVLAVRQTR